MRQLWLLQDVAVIYSSCRNLFHKLAQLSCCSKCVVPSTLYHLVSSTFGERQPRTCSYAQHHHTIPSSLHTFIHSYVHTFTRSHVRTFIQTSYTTARLRRDTLDSGESVSLWHSISLVGVVHFNATLSPSRCYRVSQISRSYSGEMLPYFTHPLTYSLLNHSPTLHAVSSDTLSQILSFGG
jgi:hypothetical protein